MSQARSSDDRFVASGAASSHNGGLQTHIPDAVASELGYPRRIFWFRDDEGRCYAVPADDVGGARS